MNIWQPFQNLWSLFYPKLCMACNRHLSRKAEVICLHCQYKLPKTNFHLDKENPMTEHFWGRVPISYAAAFYYFSKGTRVQKLIHKLKYENQARIGERLGNLYGQILRDNDFFQEIDYIVPVPLHAARQRQRGYNQAERFGFGLSAAMGKPLLKALHRKQATTTQTKKSRIDRFQNVEEAFVLQRKEMVKGKHLLLVDDVITTGATFEACALKLLESEGAKVSIASIAFASNY